MINKWASWCGPCQAEFPVFESVAHRARQGGRVPRPQRRATRTPPRKRFLAKRSLPFPSYTDPDEEIARAIEAPKNFPMTVFIDRDGKTGQHPLRARTRATEQLNDDIERYLG